MHKYKVELSANVDVCVQIDLILKTSFLSFDIMFVTDGSLSMFLYVIWNKQTNEITNVQNKPCSRDNRSIVVEYTHNVTTILAHHTPTRLIRVCT
jgi:hypothetical protein